MPKISHTSAFKLCEDGKCDDPKEGAADAIECKKSNTCKGSGCYYQLFQRPKGGKADDPWDVTPVDGANETKKKAEFEYTCLCVSPILPSGYTLCDSPLCKLTDSQAMGDAPEVECSGDCADPCKCNLFRLHVKPKKAEKKAAATWEFVATPGKKRNARADITTAVFARNNGRLLAESRLGQNFRCFAGRKKTRAANGHTRIRGITRKVAFPALSRAFTQPAITKIKGLAQRFCGIESK